MFTVKSIKILDGCQHIKNLKIGKTYVFEHKLPHDFFDDHICITAIVGQNGAGKSSLLDMMFRIINNFSFCLFKDTRRSAADLLTYIEDIYADLTYMIDGEECSVMCRGGFVAFKSGNLKAKFTHTTIEEDLDIRWRERFISFPETNVANYRQKKLFAEKFFYSIVTNYSIQAFVASDYAHEHTFTYDPEVGEPNNKGDYVFKHTGSWLNNLFHKNDGYLTPIVLNPYRTDGWINMTNEEHLTVSRLTAILLDEKLGKQFLDGYTLDNIHFKILPRTLQEKFLDIETNEKLYPNDEEVDMHNKFKRRDEKEWEYSGDKDLEKFSLVATQEYTYAHEILKALGCEVKEGMSKLQLFIREYIVYKVLSVAEKYPSYVRYKDSVGNISYTFYEGQPPNKRSTLENAQKLANEVRDDKSHIGLKLRQALNFIKVEGKFTDDLKDLVFDEKEYEAITGLNFGKMSLEERMEHLPPGIFHSQLYLTPQVKDKAKESIPLNHLSSGERQLIYLMSTLAYHAINIDSVPRTENRVKYERLNLVMDEVEICFHPEYQRVFVNRLLNMLKRMGFNEKFDINVIITTHSPFVLSDIPDENILCLKRGMPHKGEEVLRRTFCANMYDLLANQFFMKEFVGEFAHDKLDLLIKKVNQNNELSEDEYLRLTKEVDRIGDDFIREKMIEKLNDRIPRVFAMAQKRNRLQKMIDQIDAELSKKV